MLANLALSYQALRFNVFFNGLLLADSDFATDSDGSGNQTIVLTDSADSGDIVTIVTYEAASGIDSAEALKLIDANALDSARALNLIPKFGIDFIDSSTVIDIINSEGLDSDLVKNLVDSAYVQLRDRFGDGDSSLVNNIISATVNGSYVQARQTLYTNADFLDSTTVSGVVDAAYVQARQTTYTIPTFGNDFIDSTAALTLIDANALDSARAIDLVDSAYIKHRTQIGISNIDFGPTRIEFGSGANVSFIERHTSGYFNFKHNDSNQIRLGDTTGVIVKGPKIKLQMPGTDGTVLEAHDSGISVFNPNGTYGKLNRHTIPQGAGTLALTSDISSTLTLGNDFIDSDQAKILIDANALDSGRAISLIDSAYIQERRPAESRFEVTNSGSSAYSFIGDGFSSSRNNPELFLQRGKTYSFVVNASGHPFQIRTSSGGSAYNTGVTNNGVQVGTLTFTPDMNAPNTLYYQCTAHSGKVGTIHIFDLNTSLDSARGTALITSTVDAAYVQARQTTYTIPAFGTDYIDSTAALTLIDANALDSARATSLINAAYVQARQTTYTNADFLDSTTILGMVDSAYIQQRRPAESRFEVTHSGSSAYTFNGDGFSSGRNNPDIHLHRGKTYRFEVNASGHPFQIRVSSGGSAYNTGVTNNGVQVGTLVFTPDMNAPHKLVYQCTNHGGMVGNIYINDDTSFIDSARVSSIITADVDAAFVAALGTSAIPNLPTSKITSGTFDSARIPVLSTSDIITGTFDSARIPTLSGSDITAGTIDSDRLPIGVFGGGGGGGSGISGITVQEEGSSLSTLATALNFVGSAVTATGSGATKTITISGGGSGTLDSDLTTALIDSDYVQARQAAGSGFTVQDEGSSLSTLATTVNFVGSGVTATGSGATKTITIPGGAATSTFQSDRITITEFTADSGQTSFTGLDYTVGKTQVFLNGIQLVNTSDYTATNGSSIVLGTGADSGNTITVVSHKLQDQLFGAATTIKNYFYTNTDSQNTTFTGADDHNQTLTYTPDRLQVYLNGILLKDSDDFTASNGSSIVLTQGADSNDILSVITYITGSISTFDSAGVIAFIDSSYVASRVTIPTFGADFIDSAAAVTLIDANALDSARALDLIPKFGTDFIDSTAALTLIDANALDSARATSLINSAYVQARQTTYTIPTLGGDFVDSAQSLILIDANALDSGRATRLIDSDYVQLRQSGGAITVQEEGSSLSTSATTLNFVGDNVTASGTGATKTITITGGGGGVDSAGVTTIVNTKLATTDVTDFIGADGQANQVLKSLGDGNVEWTNLRIPEFTPSTSTTVGTRGEITFDSSYLYVAVATNNWNRIAWTDSSW